ncbi:MAG: hypothetical protein QF493_09915, partial [Rhodospirillales bacterium]|nr:hypothetical protein [Rhodospirillales bacterium]
LKLAQTALAHTSHDNTNSRLSGTAPNIFWHSFFTLRKHHKLAQNMTILTTFIPIVLARNID